MRNRQDFLRNAGWSYVENDERVRCNVPTKTGPVGCAMPGRWISEWRDQTYPLCAVHAVMAEREYAAEATR